MNEMTLINGSKCFEMAELSQRMIISFMSSCRSGKTICIFSLSFTLAFAFLLVFVSVVYFNPSIYNKCENKSSGDGLNSKEYVVRPYVKKYFDDAPRIIPNFLPDINEVQVTDEFITIQEFPQTVDSELQNEGTEQEALTAVHMALKMKNANKFEKARKLFQHAIALQPLHPDVLNHYGEFLEEKEKDVIEADHLYIRALTVSPDHSQALINRKRTLPVVNELDERDLKRIDQKRMSLIKMNQKDPALKRVKKEIYFQHIYHTVAIEGNTMTLAETRMVVETRMAVAGRSVMEHNEVLGLEAALRFINKTLVNKDGFISVLDILEIHRRVLGNVDPVSAGSFRHNQVFVGQHTPPPASEVADLMEEFVDWLQSDSVMQLHPVKQAALAHYKLVYIHPFADGNGRTARLLMNLILMRAGYPPVIIRKQDRALYYNHLQLANEGDIRPFIRFIARCTECTLDVFLFASEYDTACLKALESKDDNTDVIPL